MKVVQTLKDNSMKAILQGVKLMYSKITVFLSNCIQGEKLDNLTTIINKQINK